MGPKPPGTPAGPELRHAAQHACRRKPAAGQDRGEAGQARTIRNPAEAIAAVLESADKEAAARGRRWLAIAKVTAADRGNVTSALKRQLDTPDAGQRSEIVRAYCRWSLQSPDVPTLLTILRFPSQYRDCWPPAFVPQVVKAKPGYAVGAIYVRGGGGFDAFKPIFMRVKDKGLDTKDSYEGPQVGGTGGGEGTVGGDGNFIIGLHGKANDQGKIEALSTVSLATETSPASGNRGPAAKIGPQTVGKPVADPAKLKGQIRRDDAPVK